MKTKNKDSDHSNDIKIQQNKLEKKNKKFESTERKKSKINNH